MSGNRERSRFSPSEKRWRRFQRRTKRGLVAIAAVLSALAAVVAVQEYLSFSLSAETTEALDPANPLSVPFSIRNTGQVQINDVNYHCVLNEVVYDEGLGFTNIGFATQEYETIDRIKPDDKLEATCLGLSPAIEGVRLSPPIEGAGTVEKADISLHLSFHPAWSPWRSSEEFRYVYAQGTDGNFRWLAQPDRWLYIE